jgi:hypothetical protein
METRHARVGNVMEILKLRCLTLEVLPGLPTTPQLRKLFSPLQKANF